LNILQKHDEQGLNGKWEILVFEQFFVSLAFIFERFRKVSAFHLLRWDLKEFNLFLRPSFGLKKSGIILIGSFGSESSAFFETLFLVTDKRKEK